MQNAKDTFYEVLRGQRGGGECRTGRSCCAGVTRPGVLVEENELVSAVAIFRTAFGCSWSVRRRRMSAGRCAADGGADSVRSPTRQQVQPRNGGDGSRTCCWPRWMQSCWLP